MVLLHDLLQWLANLTGSYGWAILLLAIGARLAILPLKLWQRRAKAEADRVRAEIRALESQYEGELLSQQIQAVMRRSGNKLLGEVIPMLAQWPILLAAYQAVSRLPYVLPAGFFWLQHVGLPDPYFILPLLVALTTLWQSAVTVPPAQRRMMFVVPVIIGLVLAKASAAVVLYWLSANVVGLIEHYALGRRLASAQC